MLLVAGFLLFSGSLSAGGTTDRSFVPDRTVQLVVPASAGGGSDTLAKAVSRMVAQQNLSPVALEVVHKPGGSGFAGLSYANGRTESDHTLIVWNTSQFLALLSDAQEVPLVPIARLALEPILLVVPANSPYQDFHAFAESSKENSLLVGTADELDRLCVLLINKVVGALVRPVYFNSSSPVVENLLIGELDGGILNPSEAIREISSSRLRVLAVFSEGSRDPKIEDAPTFPELGYEGLEITQSRYLMGPEGMGLAARRYWSEVLEALSNSASWEEEYLVPGNLKNGFLSPEETEAVLREQELPRLRGVKGLGPTR